MKIEEGGYYSSLNDSLFIIIINYNVNMNGEISNNFQEKQLEALRALRRTIWITGGSRFYAARRLKRKNVFSITSISFLSFYSIVLSIIQTNINSVNCFITIKLFTIFAVVLSIFILVLSLLESSQDYGIKGDRLYKNAQKLTKLHRKIEHYESYYLDINSKENSYELENVLKKYNGKYNSLLIECPENHDTEDYELFKADNPQDFFTEDNKFSHFIRVSIIFIKSRISNDWLYVFCIVILPLIISYCLYIAYQKENCQVLN